MPRYSISIVNSDFASSNTVEAPSPEAARCDALKGALQIGSDEIIKGATFFGAEIRIEVDDRVTERLVVAMGASALQ